MAAIWLSISFRRDTSDLQEECSIKALVQNCCKEIEEMFFVEIEWFHTPNSKKEEWSKWPSTTQSERYFVFRLSASVM